MSGLFERTSASPRAPDYAVAVFARLAAVIPTLLVLAAAPPRAETLTADLFARLCADRGTQLWADTGQLVCPTYLRGLIEGARMAEIRAAMTTGEARGVRAFCEPPGAGAGEAIEIVVRAIAAHPESKPEPVAGIAYAALREAWPCR